LRECVVALMSHPRSWSALEAQLVLDDLMLDYDSFRPLAVNDLVQGDFASDLFYYLARGAGDGSDWPRYRSALKGLTGITGANGDRAGDVRNLLLKYSYPAPMAMLALAMFITFAVLNPVPLAWSILRVPVPYRI